MYFNVKKVTVMLIYSFIRGSLFEIHILAVWIYFNRLKWKGRKRVENVFRCFEIRTFQHKFIIVMYGSLNSDNNDSTESNFFFLLLFIFLFFILFILSFFVYL